MPVVVIAVDLTPLVRRLTSALDDRSRTLIGVTGAPGTGKTSLVLALQRAVLDAGVPPGRVAHVPMDGFHLDDAELDRLGRRRRKGAPDTFDAWGYVNLLSRIRRHDAAETVYAPTFDHAQQVSRAGSVAIAPEVSLVLSEGNYLLHDVAPWDRVVDLMDEVWFCALDDAVRTDRLVARRVELGQSVEEARAWATGSDELNAQLVQAQAGRAELIVVDGQIRTGPG